MPDTSGITGVFVSLKRAPIRVVLRRKLGYQREQYDVFKPWEKIDAVVHVIEELAKAHPDFSTKLLAVDDKYYRSSSHRTRRYIHTERDKLYMNREDLTTKASRKVSGLWLATNLNSTLMVQVIKEACEAAAVEYGPLSAIKW